MGWDYTTHINIDLYSFDFFDSTFIQIYFVRRLECGGAYTFQFSSPNEIQLRVLVINLLLLRLTKSSMD